MHRFLLHNDEILDAHQKSLSAGQVGLLNGWGVFSTIRVQEGVLFAFERHWDRMQRDAARMHVPFPTDRDAVRARLSSLIEANSAWNAGGRRYTLNAATAVTRSWAQPTLACFGRR